MAINFIIGEHQENSIILENSRYFHKYLRIFKNIVEYPHLEYSTKNSRLFKSAIPANDK